MPEAITDPSSAVPFPPLSRSLAPPLLAQAFQVREMCLAALLFSVSTDTCLSMLSFAFAGGFLELFEKCKEVALPAWQAALAADPAALEQLDPDTLKHLLQQDGLEVGALFLGPARGMGLPVCV